ncbi:MAG: hypothetical protein CVU00_06155 [Bacteroidetes bacterium HGW-Bacteroidetes-17]|nr:MAG: hypothetical protein CVU00_06155 [Bacteroidetes bacterium HGW-Bacteroidetes-17]
MKKYAILLSLLIVFGLTHAQTGKRNSAFNFMKSGNLLKAKEAIDAASENEKTINDSKTWLYKGEIYFEIAKSPIADLVKISNQQAADIGYDALLKAKELDVTNELKDDLATYFTIASEVYFNIAVIKYNEEVYPEAGQLFDKSFTIAGINGRIDTTALINGAMSYEKGNVLDKAKLNYEKLAAMNYESVVVYYSYANILKTEGDTVQALEVIQKGRQIFPTDFNIIIAETNIYLETAQTDKALANLKLAMTFDDSNPTVYQAIGTMYDIIFNNDELTDEERLAAFDQSEASYLKAIELKADFFGAIYNLGALYFNKGVFYLAKADELPYGDKNYNALKEKGDGFLLTALPYLESALKLKGDDYNTLYSLKQIYSRTGQTEKYKAVNDKLAEIGTPEQQ